MKKSLIICADDLGLSHGINCAILKCFQENLVTLTTIIPTAPFFEEGVSFVLRNHIPCGVHLTIATEFDRSPMRPLLKNTPTTPDGFLYPNVFPYIEDAALEQVYHEFCAQIEKVYRAGIQPTHIDSHIHVYSEPILDQLGHKYNLPVRDKLELHPNKFGSLFHLTTAGNTVAEKIQAVKSFIMALPSTQNVIVAHPTGGLAEIQQCVSPSFPGRYYWQTELRFQDIECLRAVRWQYLLQNQTISLDYRLEVRNGGNYP